MTVSLLDVNVLIALAWPSHVHHRRARDWLQRHAAEGWATCPLTQSAFVRISSNPKIIPDAVTPREALTLLGRMVVLPHHVFWPDDVGITHPDVPTALLVGHRQVTDAYLLGLAIHHGGRLATLDTGLSALLPHNSPHQLALHLVTSSPA